MEELAETLFGFFLDQIRIYLVNPEIQRNVVKDRSEVNFQSWMSVILISNSDFRVTTKIYCKESEILELGQLAFENLKDDSHLSISDFLKELANLLGGATKRAFESDGISSGLSLPLLVHAFDDLFFVKNPNSETYLTYFGAGGKGFYVQLYFEFLAASAREDLMSLKIVNPNQGTGEFEFL